MQGLFAKTKAFMAKCSLAELSSKSVSTAVVEPSYKPGYNRVNPMKIRDSGIHKLGHTLVSHDSSSGSTSLTQPKIQLDNIESEETSSLFGDRDPRYGGRVACSVHARKLYSAAVEYNCNFHSPPTICSHENKDPLHIFESEKSLYDPEDPHFLGG